MVEKGKPATVAHIAYHDARTSRELRAVGRLHFIMIGSMGPPPPPPPKPTSGTQRPSAAEAWPTCDVCHGKIEAHHFNFGAISCFSCKAFFRDHFTFLIRANIASFNPETKLNSWQLCVNKS